MSDAQAVLATLRPQPFGPGRPDRVTDPIVEPQWAGIRVLAAVDSTGVRFTDESGEPIDAWPEIARALTEGARSDEMVLDGFLTKQASGDSTGIIGRTDSVRSMGGSVGRFLIGSRRNRAAEVAQADEQLRRASAIGPDDKVGFVAIDLLWLDGESLLDVPLLERRRLLDAAVGESEVIRRGAFVRFPIDGWVESWRAQGFVGLTFRAANSRYQPGVASLEWATAPMPR